MQTTIFHFFDNFIITFHVSLDTSASFRSEMFDSARRVPCHWDIRAKNNKKITRKYEWKSINSITFGIDSSSSVVRARAKKCHQKSFDKINSIISTSLEFQRAFFPPFAPAQLCLIAMWHFWCVIWNLNLSPLTLTNFSLSTVSQMAWRNGSERKEIMKHKMKLFGKIPPQKKRQYEGAFLCRTNKKEEENRKQWKNFFHPPIRSCRLLSNPKDICCEF